MNPCAYGRSGACWPRTRSTTSGTRSGSSRCRSSCMTARTPSRLRRASSSSRSSCPRCSPPALTAHLDRFSLRRTLPALYVIEALVFAALAFLADGDRFFLPLVLLLGAIDGTLAITGRGLTRGAVATLLQPKGLISEGNALMNLGLRRLVGLRRGARGRADRRLRAVGRAAGRRRVVPGDRGRAARGQGPAGARARGPHAVAPALRRRARVRARQPARAHAAGRPVVRADLLHARRPDRGDLRQGEPRDHERRLRHPGLAPGAPASCSAACCSCGSRAASG